MKLGTALRVTGCLFLFIQLFVSTVSFGLVLHPDSNVVPADKPENDVVGRWATASCVAIGSNHVLTARHISGQVGTIVKIAGADYRVAQEFNLSSADLRITRIITLDGQLANLENYVPLNTNKHEAGKTGVLAGFGKGRGNTLYTDDIAYGYSWTGDNTIQRWGANKVNGYSVASDSYASQVIWGDFDGINEGGFVTSEAIPALWDSGGGWFIKDGGAWKVAGIIRGVEHGEQAWFRNDQDPNLLDPDQFDAVRVSSYYQLIYDQITPPETPENVLAKTGTKCGQVTLSWDLSQDATGYTIYYQDNSDGPVFDPNQDGLPHSASYLGEVNEVTITGLIPGQVYYFAVTAHNGIAVSDYSQQDTNAIVSSYLYDDFSDAAISANWKLSGDNGVLSRLEETNDRLEFIAQSTAEQLEAFYTSNEWKLDVSEDFALKIDFHHELVTAQPSSVFIRLYEDSKADNNYISFEAGCNSSQPYLLYKAVVDGNVTVEQWIDRDSNDGTFYISYDASLDHLYLSTIGYGSDNACQTIPELLHGAWAESAFYVHTGAGSQAIDLTAGQLYLDNFTVNSGRLTDWPPKTDIDHDGFIDLSDVNILSQQWLKTETELEFGQNLDADVNRDGKVGFADFAGFADLW